MPEPLPSAQIPLSTLLLDHAAPEQFALLLQSGFSVLVESVCTMREFLCEQLNICGVYTERSIQTIFLDGLAVDDLDLAYVRAGSRVALSAALPGLAGAILRRGGRLAAMRPDITHGLREIRLDPTPFLATVRVYNQIGRDLAGAFLAHSIRLPTEAFLEFLRTRPASFHAGVMAAELDGRPLASLDPGAPDWAHAGAELLLRLRPRQTGDAGPRAPRRP